jgi:hypothetical protein
MPKGLYGKYIIEKANGELMGNDFKFVLSPEKDKASLKALKVYANETDNEVLKNDLLNWIEAIELRKN